MQVPATTFKATCLELMDRVAESGEEIVVTKRGKPVAKLVAVDPANPGGSFGCMRGRTRVQGDLVEPVEEAWDADDPPKE